jgi:leucyl-tRNA synthetase
MEQERTDGYLPRAVEEKWQAIWEERGTNRFTVQELREAEDPYYNLMMFPYPSAEGLHVGNIYAFTGADVHGRYQRLTGKDVFEPIGFDAFGIHSENFALKLGVNPMDLTPRNVANFTRQLRRIGGMFDWTHTVDTSDPAYYRWTQWIFVQLFKAGLAERKEAPVNWCPSCMTVLANEQVQGGLCERCDSPVEQRRIAQWFFRITDYAQRLLDNLKVIDWSDTTLRAQENWIGRSEGAILTFPVLAAGGNGEIQSISVFTTRPDTVFGASYMVLAPEHPLVPSLTSPDRRPEVEAYQKQAARMDLVARQKADKTKTGVFTGAYCGNPATGEPIPVWIADYVLVEYGTGAIMAVPGHDQRDFEFAQAFHLPIPRVVAGPGEDAGTPLEEAYVGDGFLVNSGRFDGLPWREGARAIVEWLEGQGLAEPRVNYRLHDWCISRQRYWGPPIPVIHCDRCGPLPVPEEDLPVVLPRVEDFKPDDSGVSPLARVEEWYQTACPRCGGEARRETDVSDTFLDSSWYFLRYPSTDRDDVPMDLEITRRWLPVDCYIGGEEHAVLHLLYARFITMALHDLGHLEFEEPFSKFRKHGLIIREGAKMSKSKGNVIVPDPIIEEFGADTFRIYLMFLGPFAEGGDFRDEGIQGPYGFLHRLYGTVVSVAGEGGSAPDARVSAEGARGSRTGDGVGAAEGDPKAEGDFSPDPKAEGDFSPDPKAEGDPSPDPEVERKLHKTIRQVSEQLPKLQYNTAVAAMMEYLNAVRAGGRKASRAEVEPLVVLVAPFAPHLAEELWQRLGHQESIFQGANWPSFDPAKAAEETVKIAVQVNGKLRGTVDVPAGTGQSEVETLARSQENVSRHLEAVSIHRVVFVPDRLLNFVVG